MNKYKIGDCIIIRSKNENQLRLITGNYISNKECYYWILVDKNNSKDIYYKRYVTYVGFL